MTICVSDDEPTTAGSPSMTTEFPEEVFAKFAPVSVYVPPGTSVALGAMAVIVGAFCAGASCTATIAWAEALSMAARITAVPAATGVTSPAALTRAISGVAELQVISGRAIRAPEASRALACNCSVPLGNSTVAVSRVITSDVATGFTTTTWMSVVTVPTVARMVAVPSPTPVINPLAPTTAMVGFKELHAGSPSAITAPAPFFSTAVARTVPPMATRPAASDTVIVLTANGSRGPSVAERQAMARSRTQRRLTR